MRKTEVLPKTIVFGRTNKLTLALHWSVSDPPPWICRANWASRGARYDGWNTTSQQSSENASIVPNHIRHRLQRATATIKKPLHKELQYPQNIVTVSYKIFSNFEKENLLKTEKVSCSTANLCKKWCKLLAIRTSFSNKCTVLHLRNFNTIIYYLSKRVTCLNKNEKQPKTRLRHIARYYVMSINNRLHCKQIINDMY